LFKDGEEPKLIAYKIQPNGEIDYGSCSGGGRAEMFARVLAIREVLRTYTGTDKKTLRRLCAVAAVKAPLDAALMARATAIAAAAPADRAWGNVDPVNRFNENAEQKEGDESDNNNLSSIASNGSDNTVNTNNSGNNGGNAGAAAVVANAQNNGGNEGAGNAGNNINHVPAPPAPFEERFPPFEADIQRRVDDYKQDLEARDRTRAEYIDHLEDLSAEENIIWYFEDEYDQSDIPLNEEQKALVKDLKERFAQQIATLREKIDEYFPENQDLDFQILTSIFFQRIQ
jgi:hypothetical protein